MTGRYRITVAIALLGLGALPAAASATFVPGPNGKIAFASGRGNSEVPNPADGDDSKSRIWVADYPSGTPVQATTLPAGLQHRHPNWSPDHTKLVYAAGVAFNAGAEYALWIKDLSTGSSFEFVPKAPLQDRPTWSPDGSRIVYGSNGDLWVKSLAPGAEAEQITNTIGITEERAVWSPDGETLYYNRGPSAEKEKRDLYRKSPVTLGGVETGVLTGATDDWQPALSPDGQRLCFLRGPQSDGADLYTVNVNGTGAAAFATSGIGDLNCVWSPDGTTVLYTLGAFSAGDLVTRAANGNFIGSLSSMNVDKHFDGNADWATNFSPACDPKSAAIPVNGFTTIELSCTDPDFGPGIQPPTPTPVDEGTLEIAAPPAHGALGGISNGRVVYTPDKDFAGTDTFTYTGSDGTSDAPPATVTIAVGTGGGGDQVAPVIGPVKVSPKRWQLGGKLASISRVPVGTTISFRLSEAARAQVTFQRARSGRRVGGKCVKPTAANAKKRACTRFLGAGRLVRSAAAGLRKIHFQGRLSSKRKLAPGRYRVVVGARDAAGNAARPRTGPTFTIVPGK